MAFDWDPEKEKLLNETRGLSFEHVLFHIENDDLLDVREHPNKEKYAHQKVLIIKMNDYAYVVPFVEDGETFFFKTIYSKQKRNKKVSEMKALKLNSEEKKLLEELERDEWVSTLSTEADFSSLKQAARKTIRKDKRVNIRISERDLTSIQKIALEEGIPYQTLIASVLHKFVNKRIEV